MHTPEGQHEFDVDAVKRKVTENEFAFPIVIDNDKRIWEHWGNSMWPSTYLIDRRGYVRYWWLGELNWEGQTGEKQLRQRIEELLGE